MSGLISLLRALWAKTPDIEGKQQVLHAGTAGHETFGVEAREVQSVSVCTCTRLIKREALTLKGACCDATLTSPHCSLLWSYAGDRFSRFFGEIPYR